MRVIVMVLIGGISIASAFLAQGRSSVPHSEVRPKYSLEEGTLVQDEDAEIYKVIVQFRDAITHKDPTLLFSTLHSNTIPWLGIFADDSLAFMQIKEPQITKVQSSDPVAFMDWIIAQESKVEEKFWNIQITQDRHIATVHFDYSFHIGEQKTNWGQESWQLIKTPQGWKINSVIYSLNIHQTAQDV
ncbi:hypothetical protein [Shewanella sp. UCD-KL12]|uniref:hypothetical protein n=1 Tax=Shewanella sp. UCD-KL12 TaxID=1917163 RepID=UPI0009FA8E5D|nr:hypothetical protein [Shewanella sp. UCD-KL12]